MGNEIKPKFFHFSLDNFTISVYNGKAVKCYAAIAQPVERILGKDEVASSNLASSSKILDSLRELGIFLILRSALMTSSLTDEF